MSTGNNKTSEQSIEVNPFIVSVSLIHINLHLTVSQLRYDNDTDSAWELIYFQLQKKHNKANRRDFMPRQT